jgi:hypothetical protein
MNPLADELLEAEEFEEDCCPPPEVDANCWLPLEEPLLLDWPTAPLIAVTVPAPGAVRTVAESAACRRPAAPDRVWLAAT